MKKKSFKKTTNENELSFEEDFDESGFDVVPLGSPVSNFSFCSDSTEANSSNNSKDTHLNKNIHFDKNDKDILVNKNTKDIYTHENLIDNRYGKPNANGSTPPIDGEPFDVKRCYNFRKSTIRKLNELKAKHPDYNAYLSTILDAAINLYYDLNISENNE